MTSIGTSSTYADISNNQILFTHTLYEQDEILVIVILCCDIAV